MICSKGPSIIVNSGSLDHVNLTKPDKFNRYSVRYVVGVNNRSFLELKRIVSELCQKEGLKNPKLPWIEDERTQMVSMLASSKNLIPVVGADEKKADLKLAADGVFCKVNVTPSVYKITQPSSYVTPDGMRHAIEHTDEGVKLFLNGIKLIQEQPTTIEDLF